MRLRDLLQVVAPVAWAVALALIVSRNRLVRGLRRAGAVDPASALALTGRGLNRFWRKRLLAAGVLRSAGGDRVWLDVPAFDAYARVRRRRAVTVAVLLAAGVLGAAAVAVWWQGR